MRALPPARRRALQRASRWPRRVRQPPAPRTRHLRARQAGGLPGGASPVREPGWPRDASFLRETQRFRALRAWSPRGALRGRVVSRPRDPRPIPVVRQACGSPSRRLYRAPPSARGRWRAGVPVYRTALGPPVACGAGRSVSDPIPRGTRGGSPPGFRALGGPARRERVAGRKLAGVAAPAGRTPDGPVSGTLRFHHPARRSDCHADRGYRLTVPRGAERP
jgi:hypothetical protein